MNKMLLLAAASLAFATPALATPGNNGNGQGGCGVGQTTNGCTPSNDEPTIVYVPVAGPQGPQGVPGESIVGPQGPAGESIVGPQGPAGPAGADGVGIAGKDGRDGRDGLDGRNGLNGKDAVGGVKLRDLELAKRDLEGGIASAYALSGIPQVIDQDDGMFGGAIGQYNSATAVAIGASKSTGNAVVKGGFAFDTRNNFGGQVGVGFRF